MSVQSVATRYQALVTETADWPTVPYLTATYIISPPAVHRAIERGDLTAVQVAHGWRVDPASWERFMASARFRPGRPGRPRKEELAS